MLKSVHIANYRSCRDINLVEINNLLVLIGRNGAGKSNIMKAIDWAAKTVSNSFGNEVSRFYPGDGGEITIEFELDGDIFKYYLNINVEINTDSEAELPYYSTFIENLSYHDGVEYKEILNRRDESVQMFNLASDIKIADTVSAIFAIQSLLPNEDIVSLISKVSAFFNSIHYYELNAMVQSTGSEHFFKNEDYQNWIAGKSAKKLSSSQILTYKILNLYLTNKSKYEELLSLLGDDGLNLIETINVSSFDLPEEGKSKKLYFMWFLPAGHSETFNFHELSFGTKRIMEFIVSLLYDASSVSLIEQIEDGIHEGLVDKLIPLIRANSENAQFIIASHSTPLLNRLHPQEVRIVELNNGITSSRGLDVRELDAAEQYMKEEGPLADFLQAV